MKQKEEQQQEKQLKDHTTRTDTVSEESMVMGLPTKKKASEGGRKGGEKIGRKKQDNEQEEETDEERDQKTQ